MRDRVDISSSDHDKQVRDLLQRLPDEEARAELVAHFRPLALHLAQRYANRGAELNDLRQVALLGLLHAIDRYDPEFGARFTSFAVPTITGELKRFFRDNLWGTGVPRRLKDISVTSRRANEELGQRLGRSPTVGEIAAHIGVSPQEVVDAAALGNAFRPDALDAPVGDGTATVIDMFGATDERIELFEDLDSLKPLLESQPERERQILYLRFYCELTQRQIAERMGISQMHVSRILARSLDTLRQSLEA